MAAAGDFGAAIRRAARHRRPLFRTLFLRVRGSSARERNPVSVDRSAQLRDQRHEYRRDVASCMMRDKTRGSETRIYHRVIASRRSCKIADYGCLEAPLSKERRRATSGARRRRSQSPPDAAESVTRAATVTPEYRRSPRERAGAQLILKRLGARDGAKVSTCN